MAKKLVIVESPAKAKTINKILGPDFDVTSSMGHLRDLPASRLGVDVEHDFAPHYIVIQKRRKFAKQLQEEARGRDAVYLAPDPDREGEAISWHLERLLLDDDEVQAKKGAKRAAGKDGKKKPASQTGKRAAAGRNGLPAAARQQAGRKIYRITFHEITPQAVKAAIQHPRPIDLNLVNAQQARRILDRLVGYSLSPLLWKKIGRGLSAGRVQSIALRLILRLDFSFLVADLLKLRLEGRLNARFLQLRLDGPVLLRYERLDLFLTIHDQTKCHGLHAASREPASHFLPQ